jgi:hypothetical protein
MERSPKSSTEVDSDSESSRLSRGRLLAALSARSAEAARSAAELRNVDPRLVGAVVGAEVDTPKKKNEKKGKGKNRNKKKTPPAEQDAPVAPKAEADKPADGTPVTAEGDQSKSVGSTAEAGTEHKSDPNVFDGEVHPLRDGTLYQGEILIRHDDETSKQPHDEEPKKATETLADVIAEAMSLESDPDQLPEQDGDSEPGQPSAEHAAYEAADVPPPPAAAGGNVLPPPPPERPTFATGEPQEPVPPFVPPHSVYPGVPPYVAHMYQQQNIQPPLVTRQSAPAEQMVTKQELEDAEYYAEKRGLSRGVSTGVALALYEHFKHRKREKVARKEIKATNKKLNDTTKRYDFERREQANRQVRMEAQFKTEQQRAQTAEQRFQTAEQRYQTAEQRLQAERQRIQAEQAQNPNQANQDLAAPELQAVPPEHVLKTSAWLTAEVDKRTGQAVETPTFQYGHEYYHERAQENVPAAQAQRNAAAGEVALVAAAGQAGVPTGGNASLPPLIPNASMQGAPSSIQSPAAKQQAKPTPRPTNQPAPAPIWPWLLALAVIVVCLIIALS